MNIVNNIEWKENYLDAIIVDMNNINVNFSKQLLFSLKPGGHIITINDKVKYHRNTIALEDVGFEIRDQIIWFFGDDSKSLCLARKPLSEKTIVDNVIKWGTGGINVDGCRIGTEGGTMKVDINKDSDTMFEGGRHNSGKVQELNEGRFPANILFDETAAEMLDEQTGVLKGDSPNRGPRTGGHREQYVGTENNKVRGGVTVENKYSGDGGASRFFYITKSNQDLIDYLTKLITPENGTILIYKK